MRVRCVTSLSSSLDLISFAKLVTKLSLMAAIAFPELIALAAVKAATIVNRFAFAVDKCYYCATRTRPTARQRPATSRRPSAPPEAFGSV